MWSASGSPALKSLFIQVFLLCCCGLSSKSFKLPYNNINSVSWNVTLFGNLLPSALQVGSNNLLLSLTVKHFSMIASHREYLHGWGLTAALQLRQIEDHTDIQWLNYVYTLGHKKCQEA